MAFFNALEGATSGVLFVSSVHLRPLQPESSIGGRVVRDCHTIIRALHIDHSHWGVGVWQRGDPRVVYVLDSLSGDRSQHRHVLDLVNVVPQLVGARGHPRVVRLSVAQQNDGHSCGWFAIAFMRCLAAARRGGVTLLTEQVLKELRDESVVDAIRDFMYRVWAGGKGLSGAVVHIEEREEKKEGEVSTFLQPDGDDTRFCSHSITATRT